MFSRKKKYATVKKDRTMEMGGEQRRPCKLLLTRMSPMVP